MGCRRLLKPGFMLECANPDPDMIQAIVQISDHVPDLRMVIDHLPRATLPIDEHARGEYWSHLNTLTQHRNIFVKFSEIPELLNGQLQRDVEYYQHSLDAICHVFGENHIIFGSDWSNRDHVASFADTLRIVPAYVSPKGAALCEKFFWKNSLAAYGWKKRTPEQPPR
jgi:L-fuconolactonase